VFGLLKYDDRDVRLHAVKVREWPARPPARLCSFSQLVQAWARTP
jgi:hypothetical protein